MNEHDGIFRAVFRLIAISDLYGPERAVEWAQSLLDDPELLSAFAHASERRTAEITIRRLARRPDFPSLN
jgi:hypothetical protein